MMFRNRLIKVHRHLNKQAKRLGISCYRLYDHDLPEFPFCVEFYGDNLYVAEYKRKHSMTEEQHGTWLDHCIDIISNALNISSQNIFLKLRQRKPGRSGQYKKHDGVKNEFVVDENGLKFIVNLSDYLDTGLFLDHRLTRQIVGKQCKMKKVLNLFAYTGSFSVYAAAGGAEEVVTVDLSNIYLGWAKKNLGINGFTNEEKYRLIAADVKQYVKTLPGEYFDIIILDPPTFSNSKRMDDILDIQRDHPELINECLRGLKNDGFLYFSTNFSKFQLEPDKINSSSIKEITKLTTPFDFEKRLSRFCFLVGK